MNEHLALAIRVLEEHRGDETARARADFRGMTADQMSVRHGWSGKTRAELLAESQAHDAATDAAIAYLRSLDGQIEEQEKTIELQTTRIVELQRELAVFRDEP